MNYQSALLRLTAAVGLTLPVLAQGPPLGFVSKLGQDIDVRSGARVLADQALSDSTLLPELAGPVAGGAIAPQIQLRGGNAQASDPALDTVQVFPGFRPFVRATQSEVSTAVSGSNIVVTYNDSSGFHLIPNPAGPGLL